MMSWLMALFGKIKVAKVNVGGVIYYLCEGDILILPTGEWKLIDYNIKTKKATFMFELNIDEKGNMQS